jgi:hypothetical protein
MSSSEKRKTTRPMVSEKPNTRVFSSEEKSITTEIAIVKVKNRTNQKQVVAFKGETFEFLAGETKKLQLTPREAEEKFSVFLSKNILTILN